MSATRLTKVVRRIVETDAGPLTVLLKPGRNGRHAVVEVRVKRGRRVLQTLTLHHPHEPLEQMRLFTTEDARDAERREAEADVPDCPV